MNVNPQSWTPGRPRRYHRPMVTDLNVGDPLLLPQAHRQLKPQLPRLEILGGCCGTDARHVAALWAVA
jgi:hypothetical protein